MARGTVPGTNSGTRSCIVLWRVNDCLPFISVYCSAHCGLHCKLRMANCKLHCALRVSLRGRLSVVAVEQHLEDRCAEGLPVRSRTFPRCAVDRWDSCGTVYIYNIYTVNRSYIIYLYMAAWHKWHGMLLLPLYGGASILSILSLYIYIYMCVRSISSTASCTWLSRLPIRSGVSCLVVFLRSAAAPCSSSQ